jgi:hypothetical protein
VPVDTLQPYEGVAGARRNDDDLLSLAPKAISRRFAMASLAMCLRNAVLVGNPAPMVARMWARMQDPQAGDLVLETSRFGRYKDVEAFGILLVHRDEWWHTDDEYRKLVREGAVGPAGAARRPRDHAWYVQYGPGPADVHRWVNCSFIMVPTDAGFGRIARGAPDPSGAVTYTRADIIGALLDTGFDTKTYGLDS